MMTLDECMAKATAVLDEIVVDGMKRAHEVITMHADPTPEEYESFMQSQAQQLQDWRTTELAKMRSFLERGGASLQ